MSQFARNVRVNSAGNIVADPPGTLYPIFPGNRNGSHDTADPVTNADVFAISSTNGSATRTSPVLVDSGHGGQWFP